MEEIAQRHGLWSDGKIDLRKKKVRLSQPGLDFNRFLLEGADLSGSVLRDPSGPGASFAGCKMKNVRFEASSRSSLARADFSLCTISDSYFGPATLDLSGASFRGSVLSRVQFMLGRLRGADFSSSRLVDVRLGSADLREAAFHQARLERVMLEKADLTGADFSAAELVEMEQWGEPNFEGAIISDDLRFRYGIVKHPLKRLDAFLEKAVLSADERLQVARFREAVKDFVGDGEEAMLIASEYSDVISEGLFVKVLKALKSEGS